MPSENCLAVTVISGFLRAGKTSLLNHLVASCPGRRLALIVPPRSRDRLDGQLLAQRQTVVVAAPEEYEKRSQGRGECWLRSDLLVAVDRIARQGHVDHLLIECSGLEPPLPIIQTFAFRDPSDYCLGDHARLDTLVTVVDAAEFLAEYRSGNVLEKGENGSDDDATSPHLLALQVEFCNLVVLNKTDRVSAYHLDKLATICQHLNPDARILPARFGRVEPARLLGTRSFAFGAIRRAAGWLQQLRGAFVPDCDRHRIRSIVYRARRPFHPERLWEFIQGDWREILECKGYFWLATRMDDVGAWAQCGPVCHVARVGRWWADVPREAWPNAPVARQRIESIWEWPWGDRRQELVLIGVDFDSTRVGTALDACLLTDEEMEPGPLAWSLLADPFPSWNELSRANYASRRTIIRNC